MRCSMAIAAYDGLPGLRNTQFGTDDMHDPALPMRHTEKFHAEFRAIFFQLPDLLSRGFDSDRNPSSHLIGVGGRGMIHRGQCAIGAANFQPLSAQQRERLRRSDFVDEMQIHVQHCRRINGLGDNFVRFPDFFEQGLRGHRSIQWVSKRAACHFDRRCVLLDIHSFIAARDGMYSGELSRRSQLSPLSRSTRASPMCPASCR